jgi:hypothetical protein
MCYKEANRMVQRKPVTTTAAALLAAALLQACGQAPLAVTPVLRIGDARAALAPARPSAPAQRWSTPTPVHQTAPAAAPVAPEEQRATLAVAPSRMEIVQLGPNEYRLQYRQPPAGVATTAPGQTQTSGPGLPGDAALQIVNGNGVRGMGERVRSLLARQGIPATRVVNQRGHYQRTTLIEYLPGRQAQAAAILTALHGHAQLRPARALPRGLALRLVLGRDHATGLNALASTAPPAIPAIATTAVDAATVPLLSALDAPALPSFNQE